MEPEWQVGRRFALQLGGGGSAIPAVGRLFRTLSVLLWEYQECNQLNEFIRNCFLHLVKLGCGLNQ